MVLLLNRLTELTFNNSLVRTHDSQHSYNVASFRTGNEPVISDIRFVTLDRNQTASSR